MVKKKIIEQEIKEKRINSKIKDFKRICHNYIINKFGKDYLEDYIFNILTEEQKKCLVTIKNQINQESQGIKDANNTLEKVNKLNILDNINKIFKEEI